ncbi:MAG: hypothetical protein JO121_29445 [Deltaproteobacteria bacterium]|nr:hypothetical protein [Deltaproteobacteria bacterium]
MRLTMLKIGLGPGLHRPNIVLAIFLGTAVHMLLRWMAKAIRKSSRPSWATRAAAWARADGLAVRPSPMLF